MKEPEDLGIKIESKDVVFWKGIKGKMEDDITNAKRTIIINGAVIKLCEKKMEEAQKEWNASLKKSSKPKIEDIPSGVG